MHNSLNKFKLQCPCRLNVFSLCSSFILLEFSPFLGTTLVFQYSSQSLLFHETIDKLLGRFLDLLLK